MREMMQGHMDEKLDREPSSGRSSGKPRRESAGSMIECVGDERNREFDLPMGKIKENYGHFRLIRLRKEGSMVKSMEKFGQLSPGAHPLVLWF